MWILTVSRKLTKLPLLDHTSPLYPIKTFSRLIWCKSLSLSLHFQLDLNLKSKDGGDISTYVTNGEWSLIGRPATAMWEDWLCYCDICSSDGLFLVVFSYCCLFLILEPVEKTEVKMTGVCEIKIESTNTSESKTVFYLLIIS